MGAQSENGKSWAPGTPRLARLVCMASSDPLPGPDAKSPAFPNDFFSHELERLPALAGVRRRGEMDYSNSSSEDEEAPPIFECALAELLRAPSSRSRPGLECLTA